MCTDINHVHIRSYIGTQVNAQMYAHKDRETHVPFLESLRSVRMRMSNKRARK